ncbi:MAG TPA: enoyl-CoA hydratase/isomerase family protein [Caulobacteraceae bacterium]|jgi:enoyl-CoA hydratase/carnithine racemase|nr:enoyl-CoA hydratase/isomerase family protein [Caulobacteraceae bacterium]
MSGTIHVEAVGPHVRVLTIDNPPMNPLGVAMRETFMRTLDEVETHEDLRAIVVTGTGRAFCSGDDLKDVAPQGEDLAGFGRLLERLDASRAPIIAAINGWCVGGGFELALCCDIRLASTEARFVCAGVNMGLVVSAYRLPRLIGVSRAKAMLLTGSPHDAETAERYGLTTGLYATDELRGAAIALAERIASRAPMAVEATKRVAGRAVDMDPDEAGRMQAVELRVLRRSADHKEAVQAFREKRDPVFQRK